MTDQIFGFFALNYIIRHRNSSCGRWFVDKFQRNVPDNIDDLKESIKNGDTSFVNSLTYFNQRIKGSSPYWFKKRCELHSWITYHVEQGNGAPMFFITLSCAEHYWPDIFRLIKERMELGGRDSSECYPGSKQASTLLNEYSLVVQEYFQIRVKLWLEKVGKPIFGIEHYWVRFEFAPGRGQIHAHLLAVSNHMSVYEDCWKDMQKETGGEERRANRLAEWASSRYGMTASVDEGFEDIVVDRENSPCLQRHGDVPSEKTREDTQRLFKAVQIHKCNGFCLRADKKGETR
jgi:Helitron helicase-like domain at N-terminus